MVDLKERCLRLTVAYDGTGYHGFQRQLNGMTVQQRLEEALETLAGHPVRIAGAARTDAGVHASGQVVTFRLRAGVPTNRIASALQGVLPADILAIEADEVDELFHARFSARGKTYQYRILNQEIGDPLRRHQVWHVRRHLDVNAMQSAVAMLLGENDFSSFQASGSSAKHPIRRLFEASCSRQEDELRFLFHGNGFLYHMVRIIVGTVVDVGVGKNSLEEFKRIFLARDRKCAGNTAPPQGLCLLKVFYSDNGDLPGSP